MLHHGDVGEWNGMIMYLFLYFMKKKSAYMMCRAREYVQLMSCNFFPRNEVLVSIEVEYVVGPPPCLIQIVSSTQCASAKHMNAWSYTSIPAYCAWCGDS
jgi:hypothetical protein